MLGKKKLLDYIYQKKWNEKNKHNSVKISFFNKHLINQFEKERIIVGKKSYGILNVHASNSENEGLLIGNYCQISGHAHFLLGAEHDYRNLTTYPIKELIFDSGVDALSKGQIILEDEVWIGQQALILSGTRIGKGAIIGAGAVVSQNVPPYAIIVGNPGRVLKYRFSSEIIEKLISISLSDINVSEKNLNLFYTHINENNIDEILSKLMEEDYNVLS